MFRPKDQPKQSAEKEISYQGESCTKKDGPYDSKNKLHLQC